MKNLSFINSFERQQNLSRLIKFWIKTIYLIKNGELSKTDLETAEILDDFFSNIVQNLDITGYSNNKPF